MILIREHQKLILMALIGTIVALNAYRIMNDEKPRSVPLTFNKGAVASSPIRQGLLARSNAGDLLSDYLEKRKEPYPGVGRDIFRMTASTMTQKPQPAAAVAAQPAQAVVVPERTPEEIVLDLIRADIAKFRFLGYLTDKDSTLFLSKDEELFMVKRGDRVLTRYTVKEAKNNFVLIHDTITGIEGRVELPGGDLKAPPQVVQQVQSRKRRNIRAFDTVAPPPSSGSRYGDE